jgi:hypothetical protein
MRSNPSQPLICVSCESDIVARPEFHVGLPFCCAGCVVGGPCTCSYDLEPVGALDVAAVVDERVAVPA